MKKVLKIGLLVLLAAFFIFCAIMALRCTPDNGQVKSDIPTDILRLECVINHKYNACFCHGGTVYGSPVSITWAPMELCRIK